MVSPVLAPRRFHASWLPLLPAVTLNKWLSFSLPLLVLGYSEASGGGVGGLWLLPTCEVATVGQVEDGPRGPGLGFGSQRCGPGTEKHKETKR